MAVNPSNSFAVSQFLPCLREFVRAAPSYSCLHLVDKITKMGARHQPTSRLEFEVKLRDLKTR